MNAATAAAKSRAAAVRDARGARLAAATQVPSPSHFRSTHLPMCTGARHPTDPSSCTAFGSGIAKGFHTISFAGVTSQFYAKE